MTDIVEKLRELLVIEFAVPVPVHDVLQRAANEREEAASTIEYLRRLIGELEARVAEDDARWSQITIASAK